MKVLIIEDENAAARNLKAVLAEMPESTEIVGEIDSVSDSVVWLKTHSMPDLVFMDIHLADGSAFEIFDHIEITCPIIFTTAYDEYALRAFKVNSIAYLLKPISPSDMRQALDKLSALSSPPAGNDFTKLMQELKKNESYRTHFLIPDNGDRLIPLSVEHILCFYINDGSVKAVDDKKRVFKFPQSLDEMAEQLDPRRFFRANRQYLIAKDAIEDVHLWFNGRLIVNLKVSVPDRIVISKAKAHEFKNWF